MDNICAVSFLKNHGVEFEPGINIKDFFPVFISEQPFPPAFLQEKFAEICRSVVAVNPVGNDEAEPSAGMHQTVCLLQKHLIQIDIASALMEERMFPLRTDLVSLHAPCFLKFCGIPSEGNSVFTVSKGVSVHVSVYYKYINH